MYVCGFRSSSEEKILQFFLHVSTTLQALELCLHVTWFVDMNRFKSGK